MSGRSPAAGAASEHPLRHLPNLISCLRIALVVPLIVMILAGRYEFALVVAGIAGVSDGVDGWLARRFHWQSRLGSILDPVADKVMLVGCLVALGWLHEAPRWMVALVVVRDAVITLGALAWYRLLRNFQARPSWLSKATTVAQIGFVLLVLAAQAFGWQVPMGVPVWIVAILTIASGVDYVVRWSLLARRELKGRGTST
ncbi:MAG: CDP-alcohol phosphatidyltransferase family protein [Rhodanobacteraceae bacterium]